MIFGFYITWFNFSAFTVLCIMGNIHRPVIFRKSYLNLICRKQWHTAIVWTETLQISHLKHAYIGSIFFLPLRYSALSFRIRTAICNNILLWTQIYSEKRKKFIIFLSPGKACGALFKQDKQTTLELQGSKRWWWAVNTIDSKDHPRLNIKPLPGVENQIPGESTIAKRRMSRF